MPMGKDHVTSVMVLEAARVHYLRRIREMTPPGQIGLADTEHVRDLGLQLFLDGVQYGIDAVRRLTRGE